MHFIDEGVEQEFLDYYKQVVNPASSRYEKTEEAYTQGRLHGLEGADAGSRDPEDRAPNHVRLSERQTAS